MGNRKKLLEEPSQPEEPEDLDASNILSTQNTSRVSQAASNVRHAPPQNQS